MENTHARLFLLLMQGKDSGACSSAEVGDIVERIVTIHAAYMDAIERALSAPPDCLYRTDADSVKIWLTPIQGK
jgi:hypothetical protein